MCGSDEPHLYPVRSFTYCNEQAWAIEVQRGIVYNSFQFTTVFRAIHKPDWSRPTILAPLGHNKHVLSMKIKYQVPLFQSINPFSSSATNISIHHVRVIVPWVVHTFAPHSPWHNLQQFKCSNESTVYIFLTSLWARCFCTVCPVHLVRVRLKMWKAEDLAYHYVSCIYSNKIKHSDIYYQDINYNCLYLLYYTYNKHCNQ
jgi:hypothetical protein